MEFLIYIMISQLVMAFIAFSLIPMIINRGILKYMKHKPKAELKGIDKSFYYRDIPCFSNINWAYWLIAMSGQGKDINSGLINSYLLKWYNLGYIDIKSYDNDNYNIYFKYINWEKNAVEELVYNLLKNVAKGNNILEKNELKNYCNIKGNRQRIDLIYREILRIIQEELVEKGYIHVKTSRNIFKTQPEITLSESFLNEYKNLCGLKNFLLDFSNIEEKKHIEIKLWKEYLIYANLFGIADKVKEQFNKIYPDFNKFNTMFDPTLDDALLGIVNASYNAFKLQGLSLIIPICLVIFAFFWSDIAKFINPIFIIIALLIGYGYFIFKK